MEPITLQTGEQLDPKIVKVMGTIKRLETGTSTDPYNAVGDNGDAHGAYQFNEKTGKGWKNYAKTYLGDENAPMTPANQNKAMYGWVKEQKDKGLQPDEIDALHNGAKKVGGKYVHNNPERAKQFTSTIMGSQSKGFVTTADIPKPPAPQPTPVPEGGVQPIPGVMQQAGEGISQLAQGNIGKGLGGLIGAGSSAIRKMGSKLTGGGSEQLGQTIGTLGGLAYTKGKEMLGMVPKGTTAQYDTSGPTLKEGLMGTAKVVGSIASIAGAGKLATAGLNAFQRRMFTDPKVLKVIENYVPAFAKRTATEQFTGLSDALKMTSDVHELNILKKAIGVIQPAYMAENPALFTFLQRSPDIAKALGLAWDGTKFISRAGLDIAGLSMLSKFIK